METLVCGTEETAPRKRHAENAAREAEEEAASVRAEAAAAQSQLRKATAYASSLTAARAVADEKRASCARRQIAWPRLSRTKEMARGKGGASQILQNLSKICLCEWRFA